MSARPETLRLDRLLANLGYGSRRDAQSLVAAGRVVLDGAALADPGRRIPLTADLTTRMTVDGQPLDPPPRTLLIVLNKPVGVTCSRKEAGPLVYDLLPERWRRRDPVVSTVGRLDKDTSGLLLLTDDGMLLHQLTSPKRHIPKTYHAHLARPLRGDEVDIFASGTLLLDGETAPLKPAELAVLSPQEASLTLHEGRYHQVRRMFAAIGNHVVSLHRSSMGSLRLDRDLSPGAFRVIAPSDWSAIVVS